MKITHGQVAASLVFILVIAFTFAGWKWVGLPLWGALAIAVFAIFVNGLITMLED